MIAAALSVLTAAGAALACEIPVHEYALQNWQRDSLYVLYFHRGEVAPADAAVNTLLKGIADDEQGMVNLSFQTADVSKLAELPEDAVQREVWEWNKDRKLPCHVVVTPAGREIFTGRLTAADVRDLTDSARTAELSRILSTGTKPMLLVLLSGAEQADAKALKAVEAGMAEAAPSGEDAGSMTVRRDDPKERWLVRQLLAVEPDLNERPEPMVFGAFGRGRLLEPCVGKGVTSENIQMLIGFMNGPCSCEIKNGIGVALVSNYDWQGAVESAYAATDYMPGGADDPDTASATGTPAVTMAPAGAPSAAGGVVVADSALPLWLWLAGGAIAAVLAAAIIAGGIALVFLKQREQA